MNDNQFYKSLHIIKFFQDFFITKSNIIIKDNTKFLLTKGHNNILHKDRQIRHVFHVYPKKCARLINNVHFFLEKEDQKEISIDDMFDIFFKKILFKKKNFIPNESNNPLHIVIFNDNVNFMKSFSEFKKERPDIITENSEKFDIIFLGNEIKETILAFCFSKTNKRILNIENRNLTTRPIPKLFSQKGYMSKLIEQIERRRTSKSICHNIQIISIYFNKKLFPFPPDGKTNIFSISERLKLYNFSKDIKKFDNNKTPNQLFKSYGINGFIKNVIAYNGGHITNERELDISPSTTFIENLKLSKPYFKDFKLSRRFSTHFKNIVSPLQSFLNPQQLYSILSDATRYTKTMETNNENIEYIMNDVDNKVCGIFVNNQYIGAKYIIGNHSFFPETTKTIIGKVMYGKFFCHSFALAHLNKQFFEIIVPENQINDHSNAIYIYIFRKFEREHNNYEGYVFTKCAANIANEEKKKKSILDIVQKVCNTTNFGKQQCWFEDIVEPNNNPSYDRCYILGSLDETCDYRNTMKDVLQIYEKIEGKNYDFDI